MENSFGAPVENRTDPRGFKDTTDDYSNISSPKKIETPISVYDKVRNTPYLVEFYGINDIAEKMNLVEKSRFTLFISIPMDLVMKHKWQLLKRQPMNSVPPTR